MADVRTNYRIGLKDETKRGIDSIKRSLGGLDKAFAAIGVGVSLAGITAFVGQAAKSADQINKLSDRLGISTEALSEYKFVAQQTGIEFRQFATAIQRSVRRVSEASKGLGEARGALRELGLDAEQLTTLRPDQAFEVLIEALSRVDDEFRQVALAQKLFDSEGVVLLQAAKNGALGIRELREEAAQLGVTLDQTTADVGSELVDAMGRLKASSNSLANDLLRILGPELSKIIDAFTSLVPKAVKFSVQSFEGLRFSIAKVAEGALDALGLDDIARSFGNVAEDARQNVLELNAELFKTGTGAKEGSNAIDFLDQSLGKFVGTSEEAAAAAEKLQKRTDSYLLSLQKQVALQGAASEAARALFEIEQGTLRGIGGEDKAKILDAARLIDIRKREEESLEDILALSDELADSQTERLGKIKQIWEETRTPAERYAETIKNLESLGLDDETFKRAADAASEEFKRAREEIDKTSKAAEDLGFTFASAFEDVIVNLGSVSEAVTALGKDIVRILAREFITEPLAAGLKDLFSGAGGSGGLKKFFAGFFAGGGFIPPGQFGVVGERGPELAFGGRAGQTIAPVSGGVTVNVVNPPMQPDRVQQSVIDGKRQIDLVWTESFGRQFATGALSDAGIAPPLTRR